MYFVRVNSVRPKTLFLYALIGSIALSAVVGIAVILFGDFGDLAMKVLLTTLTITVTSILGLACGAYLESGKGRAIPIAGIILALVCCVLWIYLVWNPTGNEAFFAKLLLSLTLGAASCAHISLLSLATLDRRFLWSRYAAHVAVWSLAGYLLYLIWNVDAIGEITSRIIGVLSIVIAALTIATPVFHRLSFEGQSVADIDSEIGRLKDRIADLERKRAALAVDPTAE